MGSVGTGILQMTYNRVADLNDFRDRRLTDNQRAILNAIFAHYCEQNQWPHCRAIHQRCGGKLAVRSALEGVGGSVVFESQDGGKYRYGLTFLGVLLTDRGEQAEQLVARYLEHIRDRFVSNPEIDRVSSQEAMVALGLTADESRLLGQLVQVGNFWSGSAGAFGQSEWWAGVPDDIEDFPSIQDFRAYVQARALRTFDSAVPLGENERIRYLLGRGHAGIIQSEFWFIDNAKLQVQLMEDWHEALIVHQAGGWKSCVVLCGGILEGMLLGVLGRNEEKALDAYRRLRRKSPPELTRWDLMDLVEVAKETGILGKGAVHLTHALREFRNLIHPGRQMREGMSVTEEEANIAVNAVKICLREMAPPSANGSTATTLGERLSDAEEELLRYAGTTGEFQVLSVEQLPGDWVRCGGHDFMNSSDPMVAARYRDAFKRLYERGLIVHSGGQLYVLSEQGFSKARGLAPQT